MAANIPWKKLENIKLKTFLETNLGITIPDESTIRKNYAADCYINVMDEIRSDLEGSPVWIGMDETTDVMGRYVGNVLVGKLDNEKYHPPHLVNCVFLDKCDLSAVSARLINDTLHLISPNFDKDLARVLVSDAAPYMVKAGKDLKIFFPSLINITCLAHGLHRVCEKVQETFKDVNRLIACTKKIFLKAPSRRCIYRENYPDLQFPPEPVLMR
jgi:hypothetical protein